MIKPKQVILSTASIFWALVILFPFYLVIINAAKSSADIVTNPVALPNNAGQFFQKIGRAHV